MGDSNKKTENKKRIYLMIIGLVIMLILVIGSTYAYFSVDVDTSQSRPTNITATTGKIGNATLTGLNSKLYLNVSASDMSMDNAGKTYWATPNEAEGRIESDTDVYQNIAEVTISEGEEDTNYNCSADVTIKASGTMMEAIYENYEGYEDLVLNLKSTSFNETIDLIYLYFSNPQKLNWNFRIKGNNKVDLQASLKLVNRDYEQDYLAGKNLQMDIEVSNLTCEVYEPFTGGNGAELAKSSQPGLNKKEVGGMYRFQGNVADNYLCFGQKCENLSNEMYRIIGVTTDGLIKVIKQKSVGDKEWHNCYIEGSGDIEEGYCGEGKTPPEWDESDLYNYLNTNDDGFYNTLDETLKNKIAEVEWKYGDVSTEDPEFKSGDTYNAFYKIEEKWDKKIQTYIGLAHESDFVYSLVAFNGYFQTSWMNVTNNGMLGGSNEWTMDRYNYGGGAYRAWYVYWSDESSGFEREPLYDHFVVRPVFFLKSTEVISSGTGTAEDPFVIE